MALKEPATVLFFGTATSASPEASPLRAVRSALALLFLNGSTATQNPSWARIAERPSL